MCRGVERHHQAPELLSRPGLDIHINEDGTLSGTSVYYEYDGDEITDREAKTCGLVGTWMVSWEGQRTMQRSRSPIAALSYHRWSAAGRVCLVWTLFWNGCSFKFEGEMLLPDPPREPRVSITGTWSYQTGGLDMPPDTHGTFAYVAVLEDEEEEEEEVMV